MQTHDIIFHKAKLIALATAAPNIPYLGIKIILTIILTTTAKTVTFLNIFWFSVIFKIYPTEPHNTLKNCPTMSIRRHFSPSKN